MHTYVVKATLQKELVEYVGTLLGGPRADVGNTQAMPMPQLALRTRAAGALIFLRRLLLAHQVRRPSYQSCCGSMAFALLARGPAAADVEMRLFGAESGTPHRCGGASAWATF